MIKNIILDVGGILFDDSKDNIEKILGKIVIIFIRLLMVKNSKNAY